MSSVFFGVSVTSLASSIHRLRERLGLSQEGFARALGCPLRSYFRWEKGESEPGATWLWRMLLIAREEGQLDFFMGDLFGSALIEGQRNADSARRKGVFLEPVEPRIPRRGRK